jgi:anti-anti-sigma factor
LSTDGQAPRLGLSRVVAANGVVRVDVSGEVDVGTVAELRRVVTEIVAEPGVSELLLDFAGLRFLDSSGIAALVGGYRSAQARGVRFALVNCTGSVRHVLDVTGMYEMFGVDGHPSQE